ncbi:MAG: gluconolactonase, partial [Rhizobacter sp.]|nr:gluconolactonase [Rhizobacter sp.]
RGPHRGIEGLCLDRHDRVIACGGSADSGPGPMVHVFAPSGRLTETHEFPGGAPLRCAFAGPGEQDLYVSSADGCLYRATAVDV